MTTQDSLPVAGQALPDGIGYPQGSCKRFQTHVMFVILLFQAFVAQGQALNIKFTGVGGSRFEYNAGISRSPRIDFPDAIYHVTSRGIGTVRYPRIVPRDEECAKELKKRTLTNLYNQGPTWLDLAHQKLDEAVFAAYGWAPAMPDEELLEKLLELNLQRASEQT